MVKQHAILKYQLYLEPYKRVTICQLFVPISHRSAILVACKCQPAVDQLQVGAGAELTATTHYAIP